MKIKFFAVRGEQINGAGKRIFGSYCCRRGHKSSELASKCGAKQWARDFEGRDWKIISENS